MGNTRNSPVGVLIGAAVLAVIAGVVALSLIIPQPADDAGALRTIRALGFTDPVIVRRYGGQTAAWQRGCDEGQTSACEVRAKDASGHAASLLVCCGGIGDRTCSVRPGDPF